MLHRRRWGFLLMYLTRDVGIETSAVSWITSKIPMYLTRNARIETFNFAISSGVMVMYLTRNAGIETPAPLILKSVQ